MDPKEDVSDFEHYRKSIMVDGRTYQGVKMLSEIYYHAGPGRIRKPLSMGATIRVMYSFHVFTQKFGRLPMPDEFMTMVDVASIVGRPKGWKSKAKGADDQALTSTPPPASLNLDDASPVSDATQGSSESVPDHPAGGSVDQG